LLEERLVTSRDFVRSRAMTGKPARQVRTRSTEAWDQPAAPAALPMPFQGLHYSEAAGRFSCVHSKDFGGSPPGQILGSVDKVKPARRIVLDLVEGWVDTMAPSTGS
jgi:NAD(P)H-dependent flavin oxidoreductase YrpB (nitropropane dioxygenase family)